MKTTDTITALLFAAFLSVTIGYSCALGQWLANKTLPRQQAFITEVSVVVHKDGEK